MRLENLAGIVSRRQAEVEIESYVFALRGELFKAMMWL